MARRETLSVITKIRLPVSMQREIARVVAEERKTQRAKNSSEFIDAEITPARMMRRLIAMGIKAYDSEHP